MFLLLLFILLLIPNALLAQSIPTRNFTFHTAAASGNGTEANVTGLNVVGISITGSAGADLVVTFEVDDRLLIYTAVSCINTSTRAVGTTATLSGTTTFRYQCAVAGFNKFRIRISGGTTGTITARGAGLATGSPMAAIGSGSGDALVANPLSQFAPTTSAQLASVVSDETGTGLAVFNIAPSFTGPIPITSTSATCFTVGPTGATNPSFSVDCSAASAASGLKVTAAASGGGINLAPTGGVNESTTLTTKGGGTLILSTAAGGNVLIRPAGTTRLSVAAHQHLFTVTSGRAAADISFSFTGFADTLLTAGTEAKDFVMDLGQTKQHAGNSTIALQRHIHFIPPTDTCQTATCTISEDTLLALAGPPTGGTNSTITRSSALFIESRALTNVTTGVGLLVNPPTGASTNLAAQFLGVVQIPANASATGTRYACFDTGGNVVSQAAACSGT